MPRIRSLQPDLWEDEALGACSPLAMLLFVGLITQADDSGRLRAHPARLRSALFPYREDVTARKVSEALAELAAAQVIQLYDAAGQQFAYLCSWLKHQRIDRPSPSRLPPPPALAEASTKAREESPSPRPEGATADDKAPREPRTTRSEATATPNLSGYLEALRRLHPKFANEFAVANALQEVSRLLTPLPEFEATLAAWVATEDWTKEGGRFAPRAERWVRDGGFRSLPPAPKRAPKPTRTVDQVRSEDVRPALLAAHKAGLVSREQHDDLLDRVNAARSLAELAAIAKEIPHAAA